MQAGTYFGINIFNGKIYIGKSLTLKKRIIKHKSCLNNVEKSLKNKRDNQHLLRACKKYGKNCFYWYVIGPTYDYNQNDKVEKNFINEIILKQEEYFIEYYKSNNPQFGYNKTSSGDSCIPTEEVKQKISQKLKNKPHTEEHNKRVSESLKGRVFSQEHCLKISSSKKGKKFNEESRKKMSLSRLGKKRAPMKEEQKQKLRKINLGKKHTENSLKKMSLSRKGVKKTEEHKRKISDSNKGKKRSLESIERNREAQKKCAKYGENNPRSCLTQNEADEIRQIYENKSLNRKEICEKFKISFATYHRIISGKIYIKQ